MNDQDDLDLLRRARQLEQSVEPSRDLWADVQADVRRPSARRRAVPLALAAALLVGVSAVLIVLNGVPGAVLQDGGPITPMLAVGLDPALIKTRVELMASLQQEITRLSPESQRAVAASLAEIDSALAKIHAELENNPDSELLLDLLVSTYTGQVTLLGEMDGVTRAISQRTQL